MRAALNTLRAQIARAPELLRFGVVAVIGLVADIALAFATSPDLPKTMEHVAQFSFDHGLLGEGAPDAGFIGIAFPDGKVLGSEENLKLRFDAEYMGLAADGKL